MNISIKKLVLLSLVLLEFISATVFARAPMIPGPIVSGSGASLLKPKISISFIIARRRDCEGFGICNLQVAASLERVNSCSGVMYLDDFNKNIIVIEIDKLKGISAEGYKKYFSSGVFLMEDDSPIPTEMVSSLGLIGKRILVAGKHSVVERSGILYVSIPIQ